MRAKLSLFIVIMFFASMLGGCIVRSDRGHHRGHSARRGGNDCGPAYHWNGYKCVHNGRGHAKGHRK